MAHHILQSLVCFSDKYHKPECVYATSICMDTWCCIFEQLKCSKTSSSIVTPDMCIFLLLRVLSQLVLAGDTHAYCNYPFHCICLKDITTLYCVNYNCCLEIVITRSPRFFQISQLALYQIPYKCQHVTSFVSPIESRTFIPTSAIVGQSCKKA